MLWFAMTVCSASIVLGLDDDIIRPCRFAFGISNNRYTMPRSLTKPGLLVP
jgi:hypothetical protein